MITLHDLPPPVIFKHDEILHAISLPPLATFLTELRQPEHLVKLNDILDRFRTPKSYHRIDVRIVESSELPPGSDGEQEGGGSDPSDFRRVNGEQEQGQEQKEEREEKEQRRKREKGEPIILPEGISMEDYLLQIQNSSVPASPHGASILDASNEIPPSGDQPNGDAQSRSGPSTTYQPVTHPSSPATGEINVLPADPIALHPLPPTAPTRRVRELRLDLRTLDAAALFTLETWRREILGLEKLSMEHPDSIWYKEPTPPPSPSPPPRTTPSKASKNKGGRPRKSKSYSVDMDRLTPLIIDGEGDTSDNNYESLVEALHAHGVSTEDTLEVRGEGQSGLAESTIMEALSSLAQTSLLAAERTQQAGGDEVNEQMLPRTPSPDIILDDLYDANEDKDPDFVPPPEASSPKPRPRKTRSRKSDVGIAEDEVLPAEGSARKKIGRPRKSEPASFGQEAEHKGRKAQRPRSSLPTVTFADHTIDVDIADDISLSLPSRAIRIPSAPPSSSPAPSQIPALIANPTPPGGSQDTPHIDPSYLSSSSIGPPTPYSYDNPPSPPSSPSLPLSPQRPSPTRAPKRRAVLDSVMIDVRPAKRKKPRISSPKRVRFEQHQEQPQEEEEEDELSEPDFEIVSPKRASKVHTNTSVEKQTRSVATNNDGGPGPGSGAGVADENNDEWDFLRGM